MGYREALIKNGLTDLKHVNNYIDAYSWTQGIEKYILSNDILSIIEILKVKDLPEVLICANDSNAFAVILALTQMGIKVPEDIGVAGFDDTPLCEKSIPKMTTVQVQKELMGQVAVSNLMDRIHRKDDIPMTRLLSVKIVERDSLKKNL